MSKRPASSTTRGRGRGRGRGASTSISITAPAKRPKKLPQQECVLFLIDAGTNSSLMESNGKSAFDSSRHITDWILSRKIFAESTTLLNVGHFPPQSTTLHSDQFAIPTVDMLKWIYEIKQSKDEDGDVIKAIKESIDFIKQAKSGVYNNIVTIVILSNFRGRIGNFSKNELKELCDGLQEEEIGIMFIGDNNFPGKSDAPKETHDALEYVKQHCETTSQLFENSLNKVSFFAQKPKALRGMPFSLELSKDFKIELQLFMKITEEKLAIKFQKVTADKEGIASIREFEEVKDEMKAELDETEAQLDDDDEAQEKLTKGDLIKGYHYGSTIIPWDDAAKDEAAVEKEGKCLKLIQFTKKHNMLPQFLLCQCRYFLPSTKSDSASQSLGALVQGMLNIDVVAIVRYAYSMVAHPRLAVLVPKISKTGCPVLQHFTLPFNEDVRGFDFPSLDVFAEEPSDFQMDVMDQYIDNLTLVDTVKGEDGKEKEIEQCRIKEIRNPSNQATLMSVKRKALNLPTELSEDETKALLEMMSAPAEVLEKSQKVFKAMAKSFDLVYVDPKQTEDAGINGMSLNEIKGGGKIEKWEDMEV